jgi:outer membrane protein
VRRVFPGIIPGLFFFVVFLSSSMVVEGDELSFAQALELAEERSEILMLQQSAIKRARLALAEAQSRLGPELTFRAHGGYMAFPPEGVSVQAGELGTIVLDPGPPPVIYPIPEKDLIFIEDARNTFFELSLQLSQPLYTWGKLESSVQLAGLGLESSRAELAGRKRKLQQDLHAAYFSGVLARDSLELLQQILDILQEIEEDRRRAFELGSVNRLAVLEIQSQISEAKRRIVQAGEACASALEAIALYTDLEPERIELSTEFRKDKPRLSEVELKDSALKSSPSLEKARLDQEKARANLKLIGGGANFRPDLSFSLTFELSGQRIPWPKTDWEDTWDLNLIAGMGTEGSLFDSGRSRNELRIAEEELSASQLAIDLLTKQIRLQIRRAFETLQLRGAELEEAKAAVAKAEEEQKNASRAFEQQLLIRERWDMARIELLFQRLKLLEREYSYELALYELESLAGFP